MAEAASATVELVPLPEEPAGLTESGGTETNDEPSDPAAFRRLASLLVFVCARSGAMKIAMYAHAHRTSRGASARRFFISKSYSSSNAHLRVIEAEIGKGAGVMAIDAKSSSEPEPSDSSNYGRLKEIIVVLPCSHTVRERIDVTQVLISRCQRDCEALKQTLLGHYLKLRRDVVLAQKSR